MSGQLVLLNLFGGVALLIWATRMVKTGIIRGFGERLRGLIAGATRNRLAACAAGIGVATALQSSAATGLLLASFAERGLIALVPALAVMLGADIGSTLVVQAMAFDLKSVVPLLLIGGVGLFMLSTEALRRQIGRVLIGLALMILSLGLIVSASAPLRDDWLLRQVLAHLGDLPILALAIAAGLTWLVHSSVATILMFISLAAAGVIDGWLACVLVLGANVGSGLIPIVVNLGAPIAVKRILYGNLAFRFIAAVIAVVGLILAPGLVGWLGDGTARSIAHFHTLFNVVLALGFLPLLPLAARLIEGTVVEPATAAADLTIGHLDETALAWPAVALSGASREVLRMAERVEVMLRDVILPFEDDDSARREALQSLDTEVDRLQESIKLYLTRLTRGPLSEEDARRAFDLIVFTTDLEHVGDIIDKNLLVLAAKKQRLHLTFSDEGWEELKRMHALAVEHMRLAVAVFQTRDPELARRLVEAKETVRDIERDAKRNHIRRLRDGATASIETSSLHLDMLRDFKRIIAHLTTVAHPILEKRGELSTSRLIAKQV
ncbi:MAG: Na/Pi cotransporter family protein [Hyphomicrobiaceae bacterium]|nr:Na/Pi cotransporter family protein [Hyphomicrobiaceae bacterium]